MNMNEKLWKEFLKTPQTKKEKETLGEAVVAIVEETKEETEANYWYSAPIVIELSDGSALIPQSDDEGNDGGALWIANSKGKEDLAPVIRG